MTSDETGSDMPTWAETHVKSFDKLRDHIDKLRDHIEATAREAKKATHSLAWRGHARAEWNLKTTLDRRLQELAPNESYEQWLGREQAVICRFRQEAKAYTSETEQRYQQGIWETLAFGRHAGLPTRLLDWTWSPWVAAWFACHEHSDADGAIWWFNQSQLEQVIHVQWDNWRVPTRAQYQGLRTCRRPTRNASG